MKEKIEEIEITNLLWEQIKRQNRVYDKDKQLESRGKLFKANKRHTGTGQTHKKVSTLPYREMSILEDETRTKMTIGGHPPLTTHRKNRTYVTTEKKIYQDYNYEGWTLRTGNENKMARESLREKGTISTLMLTKEEYRELFKLIKEETSNHQGHYVIITTEKKLKMRTGTT